MKAPLARALRQHHKVIRTLLGITPYTDAQTRLVALKLAEAAAGVVETRVGIINRNAGRSMVESTIKPAGDEQMWFNQFRVGVWPKYFDGVQFAQPCTNSMWCSAAIASRGRS